ncbi:membrane protein insertase YidC [Parapedomonas caeni]
MGNNKNLILAMVLSVLILVGWDYVFPQPKPAAPVATAPAATTESATADSVPGATEPADRVRPRAVVLTESPRVAIDTPKLKGSIALKGARLDDLMLTRYREAVEKDSANIVLLSPAGTAETYFAELGWSAAGTGLAVPDRNTVWSADAATLTPEKPVTLRWDNGQGLVFSLTFAIDKDYMFTVTRTVENRSTGPVALAGYGRLSRGSIPKHQTFAVLHEGPLGVFNGTLEEEKYADLVEDGPVNYDSTGGWLGMTDHYWLTALVPDQKAQFKATFRAPDGRYQADFLQTPLTIGAGARHSDTVRLFAGAKEVALIDRYEKQYGIALFDRAIDWGWFYFLTRPIFFVLDWLYKLMGNFGLAIIGLTVIVKAIMFPLANKSYASMNKLKLLQPKMKELQERYADDKQQQQRAIMEMYQKEKVNPLGGCLPILLQIPVFFALYKVLFVTIEMRHQPFFGWIRDLSAPDPLTPVNLFGLLPFTPPSFLAIGILPIIMGVTMWLQQRLNPAPVDPVQQKVFAFMPIIFTFILAPFAAGLVVYWTVNNVLSILQQWVLLKRHANEPGKA